MPSTKQDSVTRREAMGALAAIGGVLAASGSSAARAETTPAQTRERVRSIRLAHMTDTHIQPERGAFDGVAACLDHAMALSHRPELVVTGGDLIMDGFEASRERTALQWEMFTRVLKDRCAVPVEHTLGNHDIWGWNQKKSKTSSNEPEWGKKWALDALGVSSAYRVIDRGAWRIVILDSISPHRGDEYVARLDDEQAEWLAQTLKSAAQAKKHVAVVSHVPILGVSVFDLDAEVRDEEWRMSGGVMHADAKRIFTLFREHGCVRLAISGHIHKLDRCEYEGVAYICDGAVSGAWWKGKGQRCDEGYGVFDLYEDGGFEHQYNTYGWAAKE